jgi:hypothetical protein
MLWYCIGKAERAGAWFLRWKVAPVLQNAFGKQYESKVRLFFRNANKFLNKNFTRIIYLKSISSCIFFFHFTFQFLTLDIKKLPEAESKRSMSCFW